MPSGKSVLQINPGQARPFARVAVATLKNNWEVLLILSLAAAVFRPWSMSILPTFDFSEFLPQAAAHDSSIAQYIAIVAELGTQGRMCLLQYVHMVIAWQAFGMWAPGWHWTYFALLSAVVIAGWKVMLRVGVSRPAATIALTVWAMMEPTAGAWLRPTGEPIALLLALLAFRVGLGYADASDWRRRAVIVVSCAVGAMLAKDVLAAIVPLCWIGTRFRVHDGNWEWTPWQRRDTILILALAAAVLAVMVPIAYVALNAPKGNYAGQFGEKLFDLSNAAERLQVTFLPLRERAPPLSRILNDPLWRLWILAPGLTWMCAVAAGLVIGVRRGRIWPIALAGVWSIVGVVVYAPWPGRAAFYMLPFAFGAAFGAAHALTWLLQTRSTGRICLAGLAFVMAVTTFEARGIVYEHELRIGVDQHIMTRIAEIDGSDQLIAAVPKPAPPEMWGLGRRLAQFGHLYTGTPKVPGFDVSCAESRRLLESNPRTIAVSEDRACGILTTRSEPISMSVPRYRWPLLTGSFHTTRTAYVTRGAAVGGTIAVVVR
ncbi:MAG: hypothetical protein Q7S20_03505 [Gemmatimonadaceae bacterium]|nr:hypothetical protein [Gemmatimonadaceae bacterium]